mmetsp:Transcript_29256/g.26700  ORF Transcript_29256/g.26700 Transcript_29256/m.26700 type:complete len:99 (-) Transcript_29256:773-1069(-)
MSRLQKRNSAQLSKIESYDGGLPSIRIEDDICIKELLFESRFLVYKVYSETEDQDYIMKVFPYQDNQPHPSFHEESRALQLNHPNIVKVLATEENQLI